MFTLFSVPIDAPDFQELISLLDAELAVTDQEDHAFYNQFNGTAKLSQVVVVYDEQSTPVACGALRRYDETTAEIKRMYVRHEFRGRGAAQQILGYLEVLALQHGYQRCILETGVRQLPAIKLYERYGFTRIPGYGPYAGVEGSICMEKKLETST